MQRLADLAMQFNSLSVSSKTSSSTKINDDMLSIGYIYDEKEVDQQMVNFDLQKFYQFIRFDINNENVGKMLQIMYESMGKNYEKKKSWGSSNRLQKVESLEQQWFQATKDTIEKLPNKIFLSRDYIYLKNSKHYRVHSVFKKSYGKWRFEPHANEGESVMAHVQELATWHDAYQSLENYFCCKLSNDKEYVGTHITSENI